MRHLGASRVRSRRESLAERTGLDLAVRYRSLVTPPSAEELVTAVRSVAEGGALLAPSITRRLIGRFAEQLAHDTKVSSRLERLTTREREVLAAIARGLNNTEISEKLFIGAATVKSHVSSILTKLGLRDRAQAVVFAYESGVAEPGDHDIGY